MNKLLFASRKAVLVLAVAALAALLAQDANAAGFTGGWSGGWGSDEVHGSCGNLASDAGTTDITGNVYTVDKSGTCALVGFPVLPCDLDLQYILPAAPSCNQVSVDPDRWVLDVNAKCNDSGLVVTGALTCQGVEDNVDDNLGLQHNGMDLGDEGVSQTTRNFICNKVFGTADAEVLSHQITYSDSACTQLVVDTGATTMQTCHADTILPAPPNCTDAVIGGDVNTVTNLRAQNDSNAACIFNPKVWNSKCSTKKDQGIVKGRFLGQPPAGSEGSDPPLLAIDVTAIDQGTVELNGRSTEGCKIKDVDNDGTPDLECKFKSCDAGEFIIPGPIQKHGTGMVSMTANRGSGSVVQCSGTVGTN